VFAAGVASLLVSLRDNTPRVHLIQGNRPVNRSAADPLDLTAHNSPTLVANPTDPANLALANRIDSPRFSCALRTSFDGGATWLNVPVPSPAGAAIGCFAPDVAFGPDGVLYLSYTSFADVPPHGTVPDAVWMVTSSDGGRTLDPPVRASGPLAFQLRLTADPTRPGRVYLCWVQASETSTWGFVGDDNPIVVSRSEDAGHTWLAPTRVSPQARARVVAPAMATGVHDELYVAYVDVEDDKLDYLGAHKGRGGEPYAGPWSLIVAHSTDGGATWQESVAEPNLIPTRRFLMIFPPTPAIAVDRRRHRAFVAFQDGRLGDSDVWLWRSTDAAASWSRPTRVNDTRRKDGTSQYLPALAIAPNGRLDVVYYDRRADKANAANEVSLQSSFDAGRSFSPRLVVSDRPFDPGVGLGSDRDLAEIGSRLAALSTERRVLAVWTDTRGGNRRTGKQDLASAVASVDRPSQLRPALRGGGLVLMMAGVALAARSIRRRDHRAKISHMADVRHDQIA